MAQGLLKIPNMVDPIIRYLLENQDVITQQKIETAVRARGLLKEAVDQLHHLGIHDGGDGCEFSEDGCKNKNDKGSCLRYDQCKKKHEVHSHLLGGWQLIHEEEGPFCPSCGSNKSDREDGKNDGFLEIGEYDGKKYPEELNIIGRRCNRCGERFWTEG